MIQIKKILSLLIVTLCFFATALFITGCTDSTTAPAAAAKGEIKITMVDSPAGFDQVNIVVARVEVHKSGSDSTSGWVVLNNVAATYNLLTLRNGASILLGDLALDAGHYTQIRLILDIGSNVVVNGVPYSLNVPSGLQSGIKLNLDFDIQSNVIYELMLDFNAGHSIILTSAGQYQLKPVIRTVPVQISGTISGKIYPMDAEALVSVVYGNDIINTIEESSTGYFKLMAVVQGNYSVVVSSGNLAYNDTTITNVNVTAVHNTDLGIITLSHK